MIYQSSPSWIRMLMRTYELAEVRTRTKYYLIMRLALEHDLRFSARPTEHDSETG